MFKKLLAILAVFTLCFAMMIPIGSASAAELPYISDDTINAELNEMGYPSITFSEDKNENYAYIIFKDSRSIVYLVRVYNYTGSYPEQLSISYGLCTDYNVYGLFINAYGTVIKTEAYSLSNSSWSYEGSLTPTGNNSKVFYNGQYMGNITVVSSTENIYSHDGRSTFEYGEGDDYFFEVPRPTLAELVLGVIKGAIPIRLQTPVVGTMRVLLLCGVGLIALLVGLKLFGKVLPQFLHKS